MPKKACVYRMEKNGKERDVVVLAQATYLNMSRREDSELRSEAIVDPITRNVATCGTEGIKGRNRVGACAALQKSGPTTTLKFIEMWLQAIETHVATYPCEEASR
ncbi:unnamed protein product [Sphenostylis stenocarpa]|uniref:Uncharacterized protein n=1 Tax=Sphenostylis stenocarpa TaxID=92480 RepID=A0AA86VH90_9FABA|nr:unnamed protein product [Sphenostylis stenocarpa]